MNAFDPIAVARLIALAVDSLGIPYMIGGSLASSRVGEPRSSLDVDIVVDADVMAVTPSRLSKKPSMLIFNQPLMQCSFAGHST